MDLPSVLTRILSCAAFHCRYLHFSNFKCRACLYTFRNSSISHKKASRLVDFWPLGIVWLVFFPNAPYLLTDLLHLQRLEIYGAEGVLSTAPWLWRHFTYIIVGVFFGLFIGFWSFAKMLAEIRRRFNWTSLLSYQLLLIGLILLSSYAIYIGRFSRLHSIHLLTQPIDSLQIMFSVFHWPFWNFVFYFSIIQYVIYTLFSRFSSSLKN